MGNLVTIKPKINFGKLLANIFAPDKFAQIIIHPFWAWYVFIVISGFSFNTIKGSDWSTPNIALNTTCLIYAFFLTAIYCCEHLDRTDKTFAIVMSSIGSAVIAGIAIGSGAMNSICLISYMCGHQMAWFWIIAAPFFSLCFGKFIYQIVCNE